MDEKRVWRCEGRLSNAEVPYAVKKPILLPRGYPLTILLVREAHERVFHDGSKETLTEIRLHATTHPPMCLCAGG